MSKIIAFVNRKGGSSKTTSCGYIAMCLHNAGHKVICIDYDSDHTLLKWFNTGNLPFKDIAGNLDNIDSDIRSTVNYDYVLLDTMPNDEAIVYKVALEADEVIIPLAPTAFDLNRLASTLRTITTVETKLGKDLASVLLTQVRANTNILQEMQELLAKDVPLCNSQIKASVKYQGFGTPTHLEEYQAVCDELEL